MGTESSEKRFDPVSQDPAQPLEWQQAFRPLLIACKGHTLPGHIYLPGGAGPHPLVILSHGFPGYEWNSDIAWTLCRASCVVVVHHSRGNWGTRGRYRFAGALHDLEDVIRFVRSPGFAGPHRADADALFLIGHSIGGFASLRTAGKNDALRHVVSFAGYHLGALSRFDARPETTKQAIDLIEGALPALRGATREQLLAELRRRASGWNLLSPDYGFASKNVLLIAGAQDTVARPEVHHTPLCEKLEAEGCHLESYVLDADHLFSQKRVALIRIILDWMRRQDERVA